MKQIKLMVIGAHPDDCEKVGGIALKFLKLGHKVKFLTATNGYSGHHEGMGGTITQRRWQEAQAVSAKYGVEYEMLDNNDGYLTTSLPERMSMLRAIREYAPTIIFTHRSNDYHPDHRNTSLLVQDCSFLVQVPNVCAMTPALRYQPAIFYMPDNFQKPCPFTPDLVFDITDVYEDKIGMYHLYTSQMYEWLPWVAGTLDQVPENEADRFEWLKKRRAVGIPDSWKAKLAEKYGEKSEAILHAEALEKCEYGGKLSDEQIKEIFAF